MRLVQARMLHQLGRAGGATGMVTGGQRVFVAVGPDRLISCLRGDQVFQNAVRTGTVGIGIAGEDGQAHAFGPQRGDQGGPIVDLGIDAGDDHGGCTSRVEQGRDMGRLEHRVDRAGMTGDLRPP